MSIFFVRRNHGVSKACDVTSILERELGSLAGSEILHSVSGCRGRLARVLHRTPKTRPLGLFRQFFYASRHLGKVDQTGGSGDQSLTWMNGSIPPPHPHSRIIYPTSSCAYPYLRNYSVALSRPESLSDLHEDAVSTTLRLKGTKRRSPACKRLDKC